MERRGGCAPLPPGAVALAGQAAGREQVGKAARAVAGLPVLSWRFWSGAPAHAEVGAQGGDTTSIAAAASGPPGHPPTRRPVPGDTEPSRCLKL